MSSPLYEALRRHLEADEHRFYMPGHKGSLPAPLDGCAPYDVTELEATGCLYDGFGPPAELERRFAELYQSGATLLSAGGSTLCIQAMLSLFCPTGAKLIMARNAHHAAVNACALLELHPVWLTPDQPAGLTGRISPQALQAAISRNPDAAAVYITSPDYFGALCDIGAMAEICHAAGLPLLVDNAHGAHLGFFGLHPVFLGADCCCDSLHKTLPALTGGALLHLKDGSLKSEARRRMKHFGSTSPSYLIMLSCDMLLPRWERLGEDFRRLANELEPLRQAALKKGVWAGEAGASALCDPVRIALRFPEERRGEVKALLRELKIAPEYLAPESMVLLPSPQSGLSAIRELTERLPACKVQKSFAPAPLPKQAMPLRRAALAPAESLPLSEAQGRISAAPAAPCPPGCAAVMPGEVIDAGAVDFLNRHGVDSIEVVR